MLWKTVLWDSLRSWHFDLVSLGLGAVFWWLLSRIQKSKSKNVFASLIELFLLASLGLGANIMWSLCSVNPIFKRKGAIVIRERAGKNFDSVQSLVDTRSVNFIRVFYCAFLVEWMHQWKHRQKHRAFTSLCLKQWPYKFALLVLPGRQDSLYFKGWTPLIIVFCCLSLSAIAQVAAHFVLAPRHFFLRSWPTPLGAYFARLVCPSDSLDALTKTRWVNSLRDSLTGWACPNN